MEKKNKSTKLARPKVPKKRGWKVVFGVLLTLVWVWASVMISQLAIGHLLLAILGAETLRQPVWMAIYSALSYILAFILIAFVPSAVRIRWKIENSKKGTKTEWKSKTKIASREELGLKGLPTWTDIGLAPVGFIVYFLLAAGLTAIFSVFPWFDAGQAQEVGFNTYIVGFDRVVAFITLVVIAPIAEELIFRGWLYGKLRQKLNQQVSNIASMIIAIFLVSLLFGIVHGQWNVGVNVFALSVVLCGLREVTGTIHSGIILHMIKNGLAFYLLYVVGM